MMPFYVIAAMQKCRKHELQTKLPEIQIRLYWHPTKQIGNKYYYDFCSSLISNI